MIINIKQLFPQITPVTKISYIRIFIINTPIKITKTFTKRIS